MSNLRLFAWGANNYGQLANSQPCEQLERPFPLQGVETDPDTHLALGGGHTLLLNSQGRLYSSGWNNKGQCGVKTNTDLCEFQQVQVENVKLIAAGWDFSLVICGDDQVYGCGSNAFGQLGLGKEVKQVNVLTRIAEIKEKVIKVAAGMRHSLFLLEDGSIKVCGTGKKGQLCDAEKVNCFSPKSVSFAKKVVDIRAGQNFSLLQLQDGSFEAFGDDKHGQLTQFKAIPQSDVKQIEVGWTHMIVLYNNGCLKAVGRNDYGQTSVATRNSGHIKLERVSSGYEHCLAISDKGLLYSWGWNEHGNCGLGHTENVLEMTQIPDLHVIKCFAGSGHNFAVVSN